MLGWLLQRVAQALLVIVAMSLVVFLGMHAIGNPADILLAPDATQADRAELIAQLGLDRPLWQQYLSFAGSALQGDLGRSFVYNVPAVTLILQRLPATLELAIAATAFSVIFGVPLLFFVLTGRVERKLWLPLAGIFLLGGLQGAIGWWMVSSGLEARTDVSQYRLATHLVTACLIFAACMWFMRALSPHSNEPPPTRYSAKLAGLIAFMALFQIYLGALVAGLDAGLSYNTWPLMDGAVVPSDLFIQSPAWINFFENPKTVQFVHRLGAYAIFIVVAINMIVSLRAAPQTTHARRSVVLFVLVLIQAILGISTLLLHVPLDLALAHQGGALVVFGFAIANWRGFYGELPRQTSIVVRD